MLSTQKIKEIREKTISTHDDELIGVNQVCLDQSVEGSNKRSICGLRGEQFVHFIKKVPNYEGHELSHESVDVEDFAQHNQANFAWTEEDGNIASLVADFNIDLDSINKVTKQEPDTTTSSRFDSSMLLATHSNFLDGSTVSSTTGDEGDSTYIKKTTQLKIQKDDPRSRQHFVKFVKRHGQNMKLWECGICSREFQHQYTLMRHLPTHTDERNFHCNFCGKSFRQHSTLSQHKAIHSAERPYSCEVCEKTFNRVSTLISHRKTHFGEKPYKCSLCPKSFHQKGNLRNHMFTHTNERPYRCNICSKGFNQQSNLVCHKLKAHRQYEDNPRVGKLPEYISPSDGTRAKASVTKSPNILRKSHLISWQKSNSLNSKDVQKNIVRLRNLDETPKISILDANSINAEKTAIEMPNTKVETEAPGYIQIDLNTIPNYQVDMTLASNPGTFKSKNGTAPLLFKLVNVEGKDNKLPSVIQAKDTRVESKIVTFNNRVNHTKRRELQIRIPLATSVMPPTKNSEVVQTVNNDILSKLAPVSTDAMFGKGCEVQFKNTTTDSGSSSSTVVKNEASEEGENLTKDLIGYDDVILSNDTNLILRSGCSPCVLGSALALDLLAPNDLFDAIDSIPIGPQLTPVDSSSDDTDMLIGDWKDYFQFSDSDDAPVKD